MKKQIVDEMMNAFNSYNLNMDSELPERVLKYLYDRIEENRAEIEKLISIYKMDITIDYILKIIKDEENKQLKSIGKTIIDKQGFLFAQVPMPIGLIAVRANNVVQTIKYWVRAIKTRNSVVVASFQYNEYSLESLILIIIKEALSKFQINKNLVMYVSAKDCSYEYFDKVIYTCSDTGAQYGEPEVADISSNSVNRNKKYVYIENEDFRAYANQNGDTELLTGEIDEVISKAKNAEAAVIYTKDSQKAYKFINLACCDNVFVNTNLKNTFDKISSEDEMYKYRNVIVPVPKELINRKEVSKEITQAKNDESEKKNDDKMMITYKETLWQKIKLRFKDFFRF